MTDASQATDRLEARNSKRGQNSARCERLRLKQPERENAAARPNCQEVAVASDGVFEL